MRTWWSPALAVWTRHLGVRPNVHMFQHYIGSLIDQGKTPDAIADHLDNYLSTFHGTPYKPNMGRFAETFGQWAHPIVKRGERGQLFPSGDPRWHDPQYTDLAIQHYTKGAQ